MLTRFLLSFAERKNLVGVSALAEMTGSLLRAVILARLLTPDQYGVAVALALVLSLAETIADVGLDRSILRLRLDRDGALQRNTLHSLGIARAGIMALAMLALAAPMATLFKAPDATSAFALMAFCPLLRGFCHLGPKEAARHYNFGIDALSTIILHVAITVFTIIFALIIGTYWSVVIGLLIGYVLHLLVTHIVATEKWALAWDRETASEAWRFGAPLLPNGIAQGIKNIGDRLIVGALLGPASLALYSVTVMIGIMPRGVILRYVTTVFIPRFVNTGPGSQAYPLMGAFAVLLSVIAGMLGIGIVCFGAPVVTLVFGPAYVPSQSLVGGVAVMAAAKVMFAVVSLPAIAFGVTKLILIGSAGSLIGISLGAFLLFLEPDLTRFVLAVAIADSLALAVALYVGRDLVALRPIIVPIATLAPVVGLGAMAGFSHLLVGATWTARLGAAVLFASAFLLAAVFLLRFSGSSPSMMRDILRAKPPANQRKGAQGDEG